jgi:hypothetical protein
MSRARIWIVAALAFAVLALGWNSLAHATPGVCKPVRACEAVKPLPRVPVCQPVRKIAPPVPVCQPVKACERVDGNVKHVALRNHLAPALGTRRAGHVGHRHGHGTVYAAPEGTAPSAAPQLPPSPAPAPTKA